MAAGRAPLAPESGQELREALKEVERWERSQPDLWFWEKLGRIPFMILDKLTPDFIHRKVGQVVEEIGRYIQTGGQYLISERSVLKRLRMVTLEEYETASAAAPSGRSGSTEMLRDDYPGPEDIRGLPLRVMDAAAKNLATSRTGMATLQGATTGFGGLFTLAVDIPAVLGLSLKAIQEIGIAYGYPAVDQKERMFVIKVLQFASSDVAGKQAILKELRIYDDPETARQANAYSQLKGWRNVMQTYRDNFGWKKLFQLVPVAGILFGAVINRGTLGDVSEAAIMLYRRRRILEKLRGLEGRAAVENLAAGPGGTTVSTGSHGLPSTDVVTEDAVMGAATAEAMIARAADAQRTMPSGGASPSMPSGGSAAAGRPQDGRAEEPGQ